MRALFPRLALALVLVAATLWAALSKGQLDATALTGWITSLGIWAPGHAGRGALGGETDAIRYGPLSARTISDCHHFTASHRSAAEIRIVDRDRRTQAPSRCR